MLICLLSVAYHRLSDCPVLLVANREESPSRSALPPRLVAAVDDRAAWMGGIDQQAGGTWLGMNQTGVVVAISNRPKRNQPPAPAPAPAPAAVPAPPSRGLLIRELLECQTATAAINTACAVLTTNTYAGCNVLIISREDGIVIEAGDEFRTQTLTPGIHTIANHQLNDANDARILRMQREFKRALDQSDCLEEVLDAAGRLCGLHADKQQPAICLHENADAPHQTVSSTIIAVTELVAHSQYLYADGMPCSTPYVAYSELARRLRSLQPPAESVPAALPHRMNLKGPWQYEWLSGGPDDQDGPSSNTNRRGRVKMPASWQECFGQVFGQVRLRRRFHRPTNLESHERVFVVFEGVGGMAEVQVNATRMGSIQSTRLPTHFEITSILQRTNELVVDLSFTENEDTNTPGGLWAPVAIEIRTSTRA